MELCITVPVPETTTGTKSAKPRGAFVLTGQERKLPERRLFLCYPKGLVLENILLGFWEEDRLGGE